MTSLQIKEIKSFMNALLVSEKFDAFQVEEVTITTFNTFHIDCRMVKEFYTSEELAELEEKKESSGGFPSFSFWKDIRPVCFQLIKGKKTPVSFKIILHADEKLTSAIAASPDCDVNAGLIKNLALNIRYDHGHVTCVTGTSFSTFIMDKTTDAVWDKYIKGLFTQLQITYEEDL